MITAGSWSYTLTPEDKLWAARMLVGEGGEPAAVLWTMAQRLALVHRSFPTFTALIQAYSQPINPIWRRDGSKCRPGGPYAGTDSCSESRLRRREQIAAMTAAELGPQLALIERWVRGEISNPVPKAVHFAVRRLVENCIADGSCARVVKRGANGDWYASTPTSERWPANYVRVGGASDAAAGGGGVGGIVFVLALVWGAWKVWRG